MSRSLIQLPSLNTIHGYVRSEFELATISQPDFPPFYYGAYLVGRCESVYRTVRGLISVPRECHEETSLNLNHARLVETNHHVTQEIMTNSYSVKLIISLTLISNNLTNSLLYRMGIITCNVNKDSKKKSFHFLICFTKRNAAFTPSSSVLCTIKPGSQNLPEDFLRQLLCISDGL